MLGTKRSTLGNVSIGIDIGTHSIKAVELVQRSDQTLLRAADSIRTPVGAVVDGAILDKNAVSAAIKQLWSRADFSGTEAVLAMDLRQTQVRWHHLEVEDEQSLDDVARQAALRGLTYPPHEAITDYRILSTRNRHGRALHHILLISARSCVVDDLLDVVERAGIEPLVVDIAPLAIARAGRSNHRHTDSLWSGQPIAHCVIGGDSTLVCIVRGGNVEFARNIPVGGDQLTRALATQTGGDIAAAEQAKTSSVARLEPDGVLKTSLEGQKLEVSCEAVIDRLVREIGRSLRHFQAQFPEGSYLGMIGGVSLSGGGVLLRGFDKHLSEQLKDTLTVLNPFAGLSVVGTTFGVDRVQEAAAAFSLAMGLAFGRYELERPVLQELEAA